jgi:two-component system chemotaxis sensor kinase CheA
VAIDISQFHQVFFEESLEGLDGMEKSLMELSTSNIDGAVVDNEAINSIFRAAHSIKGGSATFGFSTIASFTHVLETLLDQIRNGQRAITSEHVELFLQSVDCMRSMLSCYQQQQEPSPELSRDLSVRFEAILSANTGSVSDNIADGSMILDGKQAVASEQAGWVITFVPHRDMLRTGNDALRMLRELSMLGEMQVETSFADLPVLDSLNSEDCYLSWKITLRSDSGKSEVEEVFAWVVDDADISITPLYAAAENTGQEILRKAVACQEIASHKIVSHKIATPVVNAVSGKSDSAAATPVAKPAANSESSSIRVAIDKIDALINMVGELVITQSMLGQLGNGDFDLSKLPKLQEGLSQLEHNTRELQESVMRIRMLPISFAFSRFPRMVRDLAQKLDKKIDLVMIGENTELDKTVMEKIGDPLVHLVRNSVDHGIESVEKRLEAGKLETGKITLHAFHQGGNVMISIKDDGAGLNIEKILAKAREKGLVGNDEVLTHEQIQDLIFAPGFSTADVVSDVSGRGVGMDVVRSNIRDLGGTVDVRSEPGKGSTFTVRLPLTLAILDGQLVRVGTQTFILPLVSIVESIQVKSDMVNSVGGGCEVLRLRNEYIPVVRLFDVLNVEAEHHRLEDGLLVVVESAGEKMGLLVDDLQSQQQVVIKSLEQNYQRVEGISGATILGDGTVALILDVTGIVRIAGHQHQKLQSSLVFHHQANRDMAQAATAA